MRCHFRRQVEGLGGLEGRVVAASCRRLTVAWATVKPGCRAATIASTTRSGAP